MIKIRRTGTVFLPDNVTLYSSTDKEGKILDVNSDFIKYYRMDRDQLEGFNFKFLHHEDMPISLPMAIWEHLAKSEMDSPKEAHYFVKNKTNQGDGFWSLTSIVSSDFNALNKKTEMFLFTQVPIHRSDIEFLEESYARISKIEAKANIWAKNNEDIKKAVNLSEELLRSGEYVKLIQKYY